jgi:cytochrome P450
MDFEGVSDHLVAAVMERARSFSYTSPSLTADDYYALFGDLRVMCPVPRNEAIDGGGYIVARYEDASQCLRDPRFSSAVTRYPGEPKQFPSGEDPPTHTDARRNFNPPFSPANIRKLESELTARAIGYLEPIAARGEGKPCGSSQNRSRALSFMLLLGAPIEDLGQRRRRRPAHGCARRTRPARHGQVSIWPQ